MKHAFAWAAFCCLLATSAIAQTQPPRPAATSPTAEIMRYAFDMGMQTGQLLQLRIAELTRELEETRRKCGEPCAPPAAQPPAPEPAK